jgi:hypothetical protein
MDPLASAPSQTPGFDHPAGHGLPITASYSTKSDLKRQVLSTRWHTSAEAEEFTKKFFAHVLGEPYSPPTPLRFRRTNAFLEGQT